MALNKAEFQAAAKLVEFDSKGQLLAVGYTKLIDKVFLKAVKPGDVLGAFIPVVVALDGNGMITEYPGGMKKQGIGVAADLGDRIVFGWMRGMIRAATDSKSVNKRSLKDVSVFSAVTPSAKLWGVDMQPFANDARSVLSPELLHVDLAEHYAPSLSAALKGAST